MIPVVPDAPVGHFRLTLLGGEHGYIQNSENLCAAPTVTTVQFNGQNGKSLTQSVTTKAACKAKRHKRHKLRRHRVITGVEPQASRSTFERQSGFTFPGLAP